MSDGIRAVIYFVWHHLTPLSISGNFFSPGVLVCSPALAWQSMPRHTEEKRVRKAKHEETNLQCTEENAEYQMKGFQLKAHNFARGHVLLVTLGGVMTHRQELMRSCRQEAEVTVSTGIDGLLVTAEEHDLQLGLSMKVWARVHRHPEKTSIHVIPWRRSINSHTMELNYDL